jgi:hypothetical protein
LPWDPPAIHLGIKNLDVKPIAARRHLVPAIADPGSEGFSGTMYINDVQLIPP